MTETKVVPFNGKTVWSYRAIELVLSIIGAVGIAYIYLDSQVDGIRDVDARLAERVATLEANQLTSVDVAALWKELAAIQTIIAKMPTEVPPAWFVAQVRDLQQRITEIEKQRQKP